MPVVAATLLKCGFRSSAAARETARETAREARVNGLGAFGPVSRHSILFGDVVFGAASTKLVHLHNFGDLGVRFRFDLPAKSQGHFSVEPAEARGSGQLRGILGPGARPDLGPSGGMGWARATPRLEMTWCCR